MDEIADRLSTHLAQRQIERKCDIANGLRRVADQIDQAEPHTSLKTLTTRYGPQAKEVLHILFWGVANLNVDAFVGQAAELDALLSKEETP